jgi:hypothetical protein
MRLRARITASGVLAAGLAAGLVLHAPAGDRSGRDFDPERLAELELRMWKAYYGKEKLNLFRLLVVTRREQFRYSWATAVRESFHLARAAATFGDARSGYERVLPDLEEAYTIARAWSGASYDPARLARAELDWWVARRTPGRSGAETVGGLIADEYALVYGIPRSRVEEAGVLRAQAGRLRDEGGRDADWSQVETLLRQSYRSLRLAVNTSRP